MSKYVDLNYLSLENHIGEMWHAYFGMALLIYLGRYWVMTVAHFFYSTFILRSQLSPFPPLHLPVIPLLVTPDS